MPSKLEEMQAKFRERLVLEKEEKMIRIYHQNQKKVLERVSKSNGTLQAQQDNKKLLAKPALALPTRKHGSGVDRSRPLKPIQGKTQNRTQTQETPTNSNVVSPTTPQDLPDMATRTTTLTIRTSMSRPKPPAAKLSSTRVTSTPTKVVTTKTVTTVVNGVKPSAASKPAVNGKSAVNGKTTPVPPKSAPVVRSTPSPVKKTPTSCPPARPPPTDPNLAQCDICGRNFDKERLAKHSEICKKTSVKKKRVFDSTKMRVKGTEAEQFVRRGTHKKEPPTKGKKADWRTQHETFISSIRQAKAVQLHLAKGGKLSDLPPPKPSENPDYVQCPHCQRKFNETAAERHIPKCKTMLCNKKKTPAKK